MFVGSGDVKGYRYDKSKTLDWLKDKVEQTTAHLTGTDIHVACGAQSTTFVRSSKDQTASHGEEDYKCLWGFLHKKNLFQTKLIPDYLWLNPYYR